MMNTDNSLQRPYVSTGPHIMEQRQYSDGNIPWEKMPVALYDLISKCLTHTDLKSLRATGRHCKLLYIKNVFKEQCAAGTPIAYDPFWPAIEHPSNSEQRQTELSKELLKMRNSGKEWWTWEVIKYGDPFYKTDLFPRLKAAADKNGCKLTLDIPGGRRVEVTQHKLSILEQSGKTVFSQVHRIFRDEVDRIAYLDNVLFLVIDDDEYVHQEIICRPDLAKFDASVPKEKSAENRAREGCTKPLVMATAIITAAIAASLFQYAG